MPDRIAEIRARLDAARNEERIQDERTDKGVGWNPPCGCGADECGAWDEWYPVKFHEGVLYGNAPGDIAWLLAENKALREQIGFLHEGVGESRLVVKSPQERVWEVWRTTREEKVATFRTKREATAYVEGGGDA